jgi:hypothetical protein
MSCTLLSSTHFFFLEFGIVKMLSIKKSMHVDYKNFILMCKSVLFFLFFIFAQMYFFRRQDDLVFGQCKNLI